MTFDPSSRLSRTAAGDAELSIPANGLSLGQRKLLSYLAAPQAFDELAGRHALDAGKLDRDLAKLVALKLVSVDGHGSAARVQAAASGPAVPGVPGVVLGGWRAPSVLRWLLLPLLVGGAALVYLAVSASTPDKSPTALAHVVSSPAESSAAAAPAGADATAPLLATPSGQTSSAPSQPSPSSGQASASSGQARSPAASTSPSPGAAAPRAKAPDIVVARADERRSVPAPTPVAAVATPGAARLPTANETAGAAIAAEIARPSLPVDAARPTPMPGAAAKSAPDVSAVATPATPPARLAMAAPTAAAAHPPATARLMPLTRPDPEFPREAMVRGVWSGSVKARLAIDGNGKVTAVDIVNSQPGRVFDRAVTQALSRWTFAAGDAGRSTEVEIAFKRD